MTTQDIKAIAEKYPNYQKEVAKNFRRNFILIALDSAFFTFSTALLSHDTILPAFLEYLTDNPVLIGLIPAIFNIGYFFPQIISAYITQNTPKRKSLILTIAIAERIGILFIALASQLTDTFSPQVIIWLFFFAFSLFSATLGLIMPAYSDFTAKAIFKKRGLFYGINQMIGGVIGFIASLAAARVLDINVFPHSYRTIFWLSFACSFISPFIIANFKEVEFPAQPKRRNVKAFINHTWNLIRTNKNLRRYVYTRQLLGLAAMGYAFFSIYAIERFGLPDRMFGIYTMAILLSQSLIGVVWGAIGDRFGYKWVLSISGLIMLAQGIIALLAQQPFAFLIVSALIGFIYSAMYICHPNLIFEIAPPEETSLYIGLSNTLIAPVISLGPILGGLLVERYGYTQLFITICFVALGAFILATFLFKEPRNQQGNI